MKLRTLTAFAAGYVLGTRAGRERFEQFVVAARTAGRRLEQYADQGWEASSGDGTTGDRAADQA